MAYKIKVHQHFHGNYLLNNDQYKSGFSFEKYKSISPQNDTPCVVHKISTI